MNSKNVSHRPNKKKECQDMVNIVSTLCCNIHSINESIGNGGAAMTKKILMKTLLLALTIMLAAAKSIDQVGHESI